MESTGRQRRTILLLIILAAYLALGVLYALKTPPWETPDEPAHFNYVRHLAEEGGLPTLQPGDYDAVYLEQIKAARFPPSLSIDSLRYEFHQPPLYYVLAAPLYLAARSPGPLPALYLLRLFSVALGLVVLGLSYAILSEIWPKEPLVIFGALGLMATVPMHIAMTAAVNNDTLAEAMLAGLTWIALRRATGRMRDRAFVIGGGAAVRGRAGHQDDDLFAGRGCAAGGRDFLPASTAPSRSTGRETLRYTQGDK